MPRTGVSQKLLVLGLHFPDIKMFAEIMQNRLRLTCVVQLNSPRLLAFLHHLSCQNKFPPTDILSLSGLLRVKAWRQRSCYIADSPTFAKEASTQFHTKQPSGPSQSGVSFLPVLTKRTFLPKNQSVITFFCGGQTSRIPTVFTYITPLFCIRQIFNKQAYYLNTHYAGHGARPQGANGKRDHVVLAISLPCTVNTIVSLSSSRRSLLCLQRKNHEEKRLIT